ncbi:hypothetical protein MIMGU_mgv1a015666mg [Erythranthe guttata]|uniref:Uncharacterized protein n=1 Tax=Erythranthe guttata TaxID=4155 RepID=A0A022RKZ3_ERYGU|nr:hypothetical protein MIMGU_mgv1a015666mg [Erythranthe guttata]
MDFNTSTTTLPQELFHTTNNLYSFFDEFDMYADDDDVYYSELERQVLQLTADDDEQDQHFDANKNIIISPADKGLIVNNVSRVLNGGNYYNWPESQDNLAAPAWISNLWKTGNGTGVFIPQIVLQSRKTNRPSKFDFTIINIYLIK